MKTEELDMILLDVKMPGFSGIEVLQKIREINKDSKIIMISAVDEEVVVELAMKYGAVGYITKPFSLEQLEKDVFLKNGAIDPTEKIQPSR